MQPMSQPRHFAGFWRALASLLAVFALALTGCARDVNKGENQEEPFPVQIDFMMELKDDPSLGAPNNWYYMVFNFGTLNPSTTTKPFDQIQGENRGKNWEMYVGFHVDTTTGEQIAITDRRQRAGLFILNTADGPVDACVGNFNPDDDPANDILVACRDGNAVQLFLAETEELFEDVYFEDTPTTVNTGTSPMRVFSVAPTMGSFLANFTSSTTLQPFDLDADGDQDAVVLLAGAGTGTIRPLLSNGDGTFSTGVETTIPGIPVDAIFAELDAPGVVGIPDLAILTVDAPGGAGTVRIFTGAAGNTFVAGPTFAVGTDPVQIGGGFLDAGTEVDLAVANAGDNTVDVFLGAAGASFTADAGVTAPGELRGVTINNVMGQGGDIVVSYDDAGTGNIAAFMREADGPISETPVTRDIERPAGPLISFDAGADTRPDVFNLDPGSATTAGNVVIARSERVTPTGTTTPAFDFAEFPILYPTGDGAVRIAPVDFERDDDIDLIVPNAGTGPNGNNIAVYVNLGRYQFADVNIYWVDGHRWGLEGPPSVSTQPWYVSHSIEGSRIRLTVDATQFLSLAELPPEELLRGQTSRGYFIVDFMTADAPIDWEHRRRAGLPLDTTGIITEHFTQPVVVPMSIGYLDNNATHQIVELPQSPPERDIIDWQIEAN